jgi:hypothetical protein
MHTKYLTFTKNMTWALCLLIGFPNESKAQETAQTYRAIETNWGINAEYFTRKGNYIFGEMQFLQTANSTVRSLTYLPFYQADMKLGFEKRLTNFWGVGGSGRYQVQNQQEKRLLAAHLAHSGSIKTLELLKQIEFERIDNFVNKADYRLNLLVSLSRSFRLKTKQLRPIISIQAFKLWPAESSLPPENKRFLDKLRLRAELALLLTEDISVNIYYLQETDYVFALAQFDQNGKMLAADRFLNIITPVIGFRLHYRIRSKKIDNTLKIRTFPY